MKTDDLRQADLSHLTVKEMNADQRAELKRRYDAFLRDLVKRGPVSTRLPGGGPKLRKWVPGMKP